MNPDTILDPEMRGLAASFGQIYDLRHASPVDVSWEQALAWRMRRHYLVERASPDDLVAVVDRLRGLHAQVMSSVDLALWARIDGSERDAVADALWRQRTLVKLWAMPYDPTMKRLGPVRDKTFAAAPSDSRCAPIEWPKRRSHFDCPSREILV
jgi:hypothetical protein